MRSVWDRVPQIHSEINSQIKTRWRKEEMENSTQKRQFVSPNTKTVAPRQRPHPSVKVSNLIGPPAAEGAGPDNSGQGQSPAQVTCTLLGARLSPAGLQLAIGEGQVADVFGTSLWVSSRRKKQSEEDFGRARRAEAKSCCGPHWCKCTTRDLSMQTHSPTMRDPNTRTCTGPASLGKSGKGTCSTFT